MNEALQSAKSSLSAAERWQKKLAENLGIETTNLDNSVAEITHYTKTDQESGIKIVEGLFDGQNMIDANKNTYPVPANYASKSKLIEGDHLKLNILENGSFIYKQIELIPRKLIVGHLVLDGSQYQVLAEGKIYNVLYASVTFFRAKVGDNITIIIPEEGVSTWAAIENIIPAETNNEGKINEL